MTYEQIVSEAAGPIAVIRMNRPEKRNAHTRRRGDELVHAVAASNVNPAYLRNARKPVVAAINGPAIGLGLLIALSRDIRICFAEARFATAFARRGAIAEYGAAWLLPRIAGLTHAFGLLLSARIIDAAEAHRIGLVSAFITGGNVLDEALAYALHLYAALGETLEQSVARASRGMKACHNHFRENRPPQFTGSPS